MIGQVIYTVLILGMWEETAVASVFVENVPSSHSQKLTGQHVLSSYSIPGPKSLDDKIAIVGAGPSGIHMAYKLKKAGFRKVTVFESTDEIGGKSKTVYHRFTPHEMGTCYTHPEYTEIFRLVEELKAGDILRMPSPTIWVDDGNFNTEVPLTTTQYVSLIATELRPELAMNAIRTHVYLLSATVKYVALHNSLFGSYAGLMMPRPSDAVFAATNMTFLEFLRVHDIEVLKALFIPAQTVMGYGQLDEISALYGLIWMTPTYLIQSLRPKTLLEGGVKVLSKGFQAIWKEMAAQAGINVQLSSPVTKIWRLKTYFVLRYLSCSGYRLAKFDFVILSPTMRSLDNIIDFNTRERTLFSNTFNHYMTTTLVDATYGRRRSRSPQNFHLDTVLSKSEDMVWAQRDSYSSLQYIVGDKYSSGAFPGGPDGVKLQTCIYYQISKSKPDEEHLKQAVRRHIVSVEKAEVVQMQKQMIWPYFPRYSVSDMASGVLWDILDMQGQYGMWYIGSSVSFESVNNVVDYNNMLFQNYVVPIDV